MTEQQLISIMAMTYLATDDGPHNAHIAIDWAIRVREMVRDRFETRVPKPLQGDPEE
jgi:hypothetical protein